MGESQLQFFKNLIYLTLKTIFTMKKLGFILVFMLMALAGFSQNFSIGPKFGVSSTTFDLKDGSYTTGDSEFGYHVGVFGRIGGAGFYLQPEVLFTQTKGTFSFTSADGAGGTSKLDANFNRLDVPVMLGVRFLRILRIQAGPVASFNINSDLKNAAGIAQSTDYKQATLGYQAGLGLDIGKLIIDAKYESSLGNIIENVGSFNTDQRLSQFILSVGFKIF